jgi:UDP-N-acetylglucosamine 2-epimerase
MKTVITVTGIRPDFIRMSEIFKKLDKNFNHVLVHTGQHFDELLSGVFFKELNIRKPDYNLNVGGPGKEHFHQTSDLSVKLIELIRSKNLNPDIILFLGDSNSVTCAVDLKKEGYKIGHIEAGMRSGDKRMLEEINRIVCDHCSDFLFVYHNNYRDKVLKENINEDSIFVVGNTIVEVVNEFKPNDIKLNDKIILDIHRPENFKYKNRLENILIYANTIGVKYDLPVKMLGFKRTLDKIVEFGIDIKTFNKIEVVDLLPFRKYVTDVYHSKLIISDSGTAQEEPSLLDTPVIVPRDFTERPESIENNCSFMLDVNSMDNKTWEDSLEWVLTNFKHKNCDWLGDGTTSEKIIEILNQYL